LVRSETRGLEKTQLQQPGHLQPLQPRHLGLPRQLQVLHPQTQPQPQQRVLTYEDISPEDEHAYWLQSGELEAMMQEYQEQEAPVQQKDQ